jgi:hypothetical protein
LSFAHNPDTEFIIDLEGRVRRDRHDPPVRGLEVFAVQVPGSAAVVVTKPPVFGQGAQDCMDIAAAPEKNAGYEGSCSVYSASSLLVSSDTADFIPSLTRWYLVWTRVPRGTEYVAISESGEHFWQRPVDGVSYMSHTGSVRAWAANPPVFIAYDDHGQEIGKARVPAPELTLDEQLSK